MFVERMPIPSTARAPTRTPLRGFPGPRTGEVARGQMTSPPLRSSWLVVSHLHSDVTLRRETEGGVAHLVLEPP
jgi:hypothetical protein